MIKSITTVETDDPELQEVMELARLAVESNRAAETAVKLAIERMNDAARRYLMAAKDHEDQILRADFVYWKMPDVRTGVIASVLLGDEKKGCRVASMIPGCNAGFECQKCGELVRFSSRTDMQQHISSERKFGGFGRTCDECREKERQESQARYRQSQDELDAAIEELRSMPYREYLLTQHWLDTRNRKLRQAQFRCQICNEGWPLDVHHRTYERRGFEDMGDLTVLCRNCHSKFHDKLP